MYSKEIVDRARIVLNDADGIRWLDGEMLKWINDGQRVIALVRPDSCVANATMTLAAGTKQTLPSDGLRLLDVVRNVTSSSTSGTAATATATVNQAGNFTLTLSAANSAIDIGMTISGTGVSAGAYVVSVVGASVVMSLPLTAGASGSYTFTGASGGRVVRHVDRDVLDTQNPLWHTETGQSSVKNYTYDNRDPRTFYVYPPSLSSNQVEIIYSKNPTDVTVVADSGAGALISVADIYADPLLNYVLHRAYSKDAEFAQNFQLSANYLSIFQQMLGIKTGKDAAFSPDLNSKGRTTLPSPASIQMGGV